MAGPSARRVSKSPNSVEGAANAWQRGFRRRLAEAPPPDLPDKELRTGARLGLCAIRAYWSASCGNPRRFALSTGARQQKHLNYFLNFEVSMASLSRLPRLALPWLLLIPRAWAQTAVATPSTQPVPVVHDAAIGAATVPDSAIGLHYVSVLEKYEAYAEQAPTPWPQANATVQRIGGWRAYAKEAAAPPVVSPTPGSKP